MGRPPWHVRLIRQLRTCSSADARSQHPSVRLFSSGGIVGFLSSGDATCASSEAREKYSCTARCKSQVSAEQRKRLCNTVTSTCESVWKGSTARKYTFRTAVIATQIILLIPADASS